MKIRSLKTASDANDIASTSPVTGPAPGAVEHPVMATVVADRPTEDGPLDRQALEIALLRVRVQHLELVLETARSLLNVNQDRLLRRLHEIPRELVSLTVQLQRADPQAGW